MQLHLMQSLPRAGFAMTVLVYLAVAHGAAMAWQARTPFSDEQLEAFGRHIEQVIADGDVRGFADAINFEALLNRAVARIHLSAKDMGDLRNGFMQGRAQIAEGFTTQIRDGGSYRFLRIMRTEEGPRLLFRLSAPAGLNYHQLIIEPGPDGRPRIVDMDLMITGETFSHTLERLFAQLALKLSQTPRGQAPQMELFDAMTELPRLLREGKHAEVLRRFDQLSERTKKEKMLQIVRIQAAAAADEKVYVQAMEEYGQRFKDDPSLDLVLLDAYLLRKEFDQAEAAVDRLDKKLGGDPFLDIYRSNVCLERGDLPRAKTFAERAVQREPDLSAGYDQLLAISLLQKDHAQTLRVMRVLRDLFWYEFEDLTQFEDYAEFVKSPEHREWLKENPSASAPRAAPAPAPAGAPGGSGGGFKF